MKAEILRNQAVRVAGEARRHVLVAAAGVVGFALLTAVAGRVAIPVPGTPVPITLQSLVALLAGITLGPRLGTASMAFYLLLGTTGSHVFALGNWGVSTVFGATGGYLLGFVLAQPVVGALARPDARRWLRVLAATVAGHAIIFAAGLLWLALWAHTGLAEALALGFWPFVPGTIATTALATGIGGAILPKARRLFRP